MKPSRQAAAGAGERRRLVRAPCCWQRVQHCVKARCDGRDAADGNMDAVLARADLLYSEDPQQTARHAAQNKTALRRLWCGAAVLIRVPSRPARFQSFVPSNRFTGRFYWLHSGLNLSNQQRWSKRVTTVRCQEMLRKTERVRLMTTAECVEGV